jgi:hypothetical protein
MAQLDAQVIDDETFEINSETKMKVELTEIEMGDESNVYNVVLHFTNVVTKHEDHFSLDCTDYDKAQQLLDAMRAAIL